MSWSTDFVEGIAQLLDAAPDVDVSWRSTGTYVPGEVPLIIGPPAALPDTIVSLVTYPLADDVAQPDSYVGLQLRFRGARNQLRAVEERVDAVFDVLHELGPVELVTGVLVHLIERRASMTPTVDQNGRPERAETYWCTVHRPTPNRPAD